MVYKYDFLIIGSGIAGMSYALKVARANKGKICMICKTSLDEANTSFAQGGVASVTNLEVDNFDKHIQDTMIAGDYISDYKAVKQVVEKAPEQIKELVEWGTNFDKMQDGRFDLHREGGHSEFRILHHADDTGAEIQRALMAAVRANPNIDITKQMIPVRPAAHYMCGGIQVDLNGQSSIQRLYALGECSCTGLHGGNRLASNSLIEAVVYADAAAKHSIEHVNDYDFNEKVPRWNDEGTLTNEEHVLITQANKEVGEIMANYVGIVRSDLRLKRAWDRLDLLYEETESLFKRVKVSRDLCELRNMINVGYLITRMAIERKESRGLHYTVDYPHHAYDKKN